MKIILKWLIMSAAIIISAYIVPGVAISGIWASLWVALFLGLANIILKPVLILITLPINILTLGLFTFVINASLVLLSSLVVKGFTVDNFLAALLFSVFLSAISYLINILFKANR
jgi:putative membrane protein